MRLDKNLKDKFSMGGKIKIGDYYCEPYADNTTRTYTMKQIDKYKELIAERKGAYYEETDMWLYEALDKHSIEDKDVVIVGSEQPWYETIACVYSGKGCSCLEYNKRVCESDKMKYYQYDDYDSLPKFDACISVSSIEHSGLGRYGDDIDPDGDIKAMQDIKNILKKDGLLFLSVPMGEDRVMWNAHRVYGKIRMEVLLEGWEQIGSYGLTDELLATDSNSRETVQPVLVLKNI